MAEMNNNPFPDLMRAYDRSADEREKHQVSGWKKDLRWKFLAALQQEGRTSLIDIGAGTGVHGLFFQSEGIEVTCIDLSPVLVDRCRAKGLESQVLNVMDLPDIGRTFDAAFAFNSLLHIPRRLLPAALSNIARILASGGLFYWGQYGGENRQGANPDDTYQPKRFYSLLEDDQLLEAAAGEFTLVEFETISIDSIAPLYFQSLVLRVKPGR